MTYTRHGHHIEGSPAEETKPSYVARCGGPAICTVCSLDVSRFRNKKSTTNYMVDHASIAKKLVADYHNERAVRPYGIIHEDDCYVVWFSKTLQNWKAMVTTIIPDDRYYEVTYNGDHEEAYIDVYGKLDNIVVSGNYFNNPVTIPTSEAKDGARS